MRASQLGDSKSSRYAGLCYQDGVGTEADEEKAFGYFQLAAGRGDSTGIVYTADYLLTGRAGVQDMEKALSMYKDIVLCALKPGDICREGGPPCPLRIIGRGSFLSPLKVTFR